ncbi:PRELI domain containing protein 3B-like [Varroa jacobsoni]|uniref:PRELI/MSF1 domain-containing protein n=1 Tax=Varroa destructor TaxID=109461 RepID=A0A7M7K7W9_VARDE|nr:PRELI domain containing protein 3B-like isoform X1 [Varroa destructor]XP_022707981.1 PRELI domain containing protein 3B-like [Varroa jacobsoni]
MKIWTSEHTFNHPWEVVTQAAWRKYPNPLNPSVVAIDIVDRNVHGGQLHSHRLITTKWGVPAWARPVFGRDKLGYASEHSVVDPEKKVMTMMSKNLNFSKELNLVERLTYTEHPTQPGCTLMTQEAVVTIQGVPLSSHLESFIAGSISNNATKGRQAMELVISKIKEEIGELKHSVDDIATGAKNVASRVEGLVTLRAEEQAPQPQGWFSWFRG